MAIELPEDLIQLEERAWTEIQAGTLTVETAEAVQAAITAHAKATGESRFDVEAAVKKKVRNPDA